MVLKKYLSLLVAVPILLIAIKVSAGSPSGIFDTGCGFSHTLSDDPLVHPAQPSASHEHDFFGNTTTNAFSTGETLLLANADQMHTTCQDTLDGAAYWFPSLYQDGVKLDPFNLHVYYRNDGNELSKVAPTGFGQVSHSHAWVCGSQFGLATQTAPSTCAEKSIAMLVTFPECWNSTDLFKADGTHVVVGRALCPASHPVRLFDLRAIVRYKVDSLPHSYSLSSGDTNTAHGDFFNAWDPARLTHLTAKCLNTKPSPYECKADDVNR